MDDQMEPISGWLQLTDSSEIVRYEEVSEFLERLACEEVTDRDGPWWNEEKSRPMRFNLFFLEGICPDLLDQMDGLAKELRPKEYLLFHLMTRFEQAGPAAVEVIMVTAQAVERLSSQGLVEYLRNRVGLPSEDDGPGYSVDLG